MSEKKRVAAWMAVVLGCIVVSAAFCLAWEILPPGSHLVPGPEGETGPIRWSLVCPYACQQDPWDPACPGGCSSLFTDQLSGPGELVIY